MKPEQLIEQPSQRVLQTIAMPIARHPRSHRGDLSVIEGMEFQVRKMVVGWDEFFEKKHLPLLAESTHQMLWPLLHKIPAEMGKTDKRGWQAGFEG